MWKKGWGLLGLVFCFGVFCVDDDMGSELQAFVDRKLLWSFSPSVKEDNVGVFLSDIKVVTLCTGILSSKSIEKYL